MSAPLPSSLASIAARGDVWRGAHGARPRTEASGIAALDARLPGGGWPSASLSELLLDAPGIGELQLVLPLLARLTQAGRQIAFVAPPHIPYAPALAQAGLWLPRTLVVEPRNAGGSTPGTANGITNEIIWATEQLLRTSAYGAVLAWVPKLREADSRRLQLAAETGGNIGLIYRPLSAAGATSIAALRLKLARRESRLEIEILKSRGGRAGTRFFADERAAADKPAITALEPRSAA